MKKLGLIAVSAMMVSSAFAMDTQMVVKGLKDNFDPKKQFFPEGFMSC